MKIAAQNAELDFYPNFIDRKLRQVLFDQLYASLAWQQDEIVVYGKSVAIPRLQAWYGDNQLAYQYSGLTMIAKPWTSTLLTLKQEIEQHTGYRFNSMLANLYRDGSDTVGWHSDDEPELGSEPVIASLSVGAEREFQLKRRYKDKHSKEKQINEKISINLTSGSLLVMAGSTQKYWQHCIPRTKKPKAARINLTFRYVYTR